MMEEQFKSMESQMQKVLSALANMDQSHKNVAAKQLFKQGFYRQD